MRRLGPASEAAAAVAAAAAAAERTGGGGTAASAAAAPAPVSCELRARALLRVTRGLVISVSRCGSFSASVLEGPLHATRLI